MSKTIKFTGKNKTLDDIYKDSKFSQFSIIKMQQVHGNEFLELNNSHTNLWGNKLQQVEKVIEIPNVDAIITNQKNILLTVKTADCLPILIYFSDNDKSEVIAAIHAGRVGTEKKIFAKVLEHLKTKYKIDKLLNESSAAKLSIWFGPAICKKCYQIDQKKNIHYDLYQKNLEQIYLSFPEFCKGNITDSNKIEIIKSKFCTLHDNEKFHSYRKSGKGVPMNYSLIGLE
ncbi:polyphenol oxidase family protein [Candidatus Woesebacteria bacterium]|nr:polyphenol oxidase family protein [Candidatus Woesebacteria bacterium]